jgi:hypothetical protein
MHGLLAAVTRLLRPLEPLFRRLDRIAGGRLAGRTIPEDLRDHPRTLRSFAGILWILLVEVVIGVAAVVVAITLELNGAGISWVVWFRGLVVLAITFTLLYFAWRASLGFYWAYSRLRLFSRIFPIITLVIATIPDLYPYWMTVEQIVYSLLLIGIGDILTTDHMRAAFPRPAKDAPPPVATEGGTAA